MLISDNDTLKKYVPNTLKEVAGETLLFDKIRYHLMQAEQWLTDTFVSSETMARIRSYSDNTPLLHYCRIITASEAMLHAIPQLDLILTPNGFGIVSNQNIAPASKERIERLLFSLEKLRDDTIHQLGFTDHIWQHYQEVHTQLLTIEQRLETEYFSKELMDTLRTANILSS